MQTNNIPLPDAFLLQMKEMLGHEFQDFLNSYQDTPYRGLRFRDHRTPLPQNQLTGRVSYAKNGYYLDENSPAGALPLHEAGAYYIQEPSAMTAAAVLAPQDGDTVLDLCAAPGGKSTQLALSASLSLLVANEPVPNRAQILSRNIERMGITNAIVTSAYPAQLAGKWPKFFDKILVDAPCSGEGMFRKHPETRTEWDAQSPIRCAERQLDILASAAVMVKSGGRMVYSTCTFNRHENENVVKSFLQSHPDFHLCPFSLPGLLPAPEGYLHIWPHKVKGEGHFVALFEKNTDDERPRAVSSALTQIAPQTAQAVRSFFEDIGCEKSLTPNAPFGGKTVLLPPVYPPLDGIRVMRAGLHLGEFKGKAFIPDHAVALSTPFRSTCALTEEQVHAYLHGEVIPCDDSLKGFIVLSYEGYQIGFGKASDGMIKNHYPKGLRK